MPGRAATWSAPKPAPRAEPSRASPSSSRRSTRPPSAAPAGPSTPPHHAPAPDRKHAHTTPPPRWQQHPTTAPAAVHLITRSAVIMQHRPGRRTAPPEAMGFLMQSVLGHKSMTLTCGYSFTDLDGRATPQVTDMGVQLPLGQRPFAHATVPPAPGESPTTRVYGRKNACSAVTWLIASRVASRFRQYSSEGPVTSASKPQSRIPRSASDPSCAQAPGTRALPAGATTESSSLSASSAPRPASLSHLSRRGRCAAR